MNACTRSLLAAAVAAWSCHVLAAEDGPFDHRITGDWGGLRETWHEKGVDLSFGYINEWLHNSTGGTRSTSAYADQIMLGADLDFDRLWGWRGGSFHVVITNRNGPQLDAKAGLGTLLETHEIFGRGHYTRLTRFYLQQELFDDRLTVKLGRSDVDFFPLSCDFINISFCGVLPGYHSDGWYTWPISQYFADVTFRPTASFYVKVGASEVNPRNLDGDQGLRLTTPDDDNDGTLTNFEAGWLPTFGNALEGAYRIGYWRDSTGYSDLLLNQQGQPLPIAGGTPMLQDTSTGYYAMAQQRLTHNDAGGGLVLFANLSHSDTDVSQTDRLISVGLWYTGVFPSRPGDRLGFAIGQNRVGDRIREFERLTNEQAGIDAPSRGSEKPVELNYSIAVSRGFWLMPSLQYVRDPGGRSDAESALVWGLKLSADF
ncbi:carbohydrate porin [Lysobacter sp. P5_B9]